MSWGLAMFQVRSIRRAGARNRALASLIAPAFALSIGEGCKRPASPPAGSGSESKSLDNIAGEDGAAKTTNRCGGVFNPASRRTPAIDAAGEAVGQVAEPLRSVAIGVLLSSPAALVLPFYALGGRIVFSDDTARACVGTPVSAA